MESLFTNECLTAEYDGMSTCFHSKSGILARLGAYLLEYGSVHNLRQAVTNEDGWLTLDHINGLQLGDEVELRNEYQLARANMPIVHYCRIVELDENRARIVPPAPDIPALRNQQGVFLLCRKQVRIDRFACHLRHKNLKETRVLLSGKAGPVTIDIDLIMRTDTAEVRLQATRQFLIDLQVLSESINFTDLPPLVEVYRKNRQVDRGRFQRRYNLDREGACFASVTGEGVYVYGRTDACSMDLEHPDAPFTLREITPFRKAPHSLNAVYNRNLLHYASARSDGGVVSFEMDFGKPMQIHGLHLLWYRQPPLHMIVSASYENDDWQTVMDVSCHHGNQYIFKQPATTQKLRLKFTTPAPPNDNFYLSGIDVLVGGDGFNLRFNLDDYRDHRYCRYLDPCYRTREMGEMLMEMRSTTQRVKGETTTNHCCLHIGSVPGVRPRIMHIPDGAEALLIWTEHADRASLNSHRASYFGRSDITSAADSIGGFIYHGIPVTKSVFWANPSHQACSSIYNEPQASLADPDFKLLCNELAVHGCEICVHAPHPTDAPPEVGLEAARQVASMFGSKTWIDHSARVVHCSMSGQGLNSNSPYYMVDAWEEAGFRYFWQFASEDAGEQRVGSINIQQHRLGDWAHTPLFWRHPSETGSFINWPSLRGGDLDIYTDQEIDALIDAWGVCIAHTYPAALYDDLCRGQYLIGEKDDVMVTTQTFDSVLQKFSTRITEGRLHTSTITKMMEYWLNLELVNIHHDTNGVSICNNSGFDIQGLTLALSEAVEVCGCIDYVMREVGSDVLVSLNLKKDQVIRLEEVSHQHIRLGIISQPEAYRSQKLMEATPILNIDSVLNELKSYLNLNLHEYCLLVVGDEAVSTRVANDFDFRKILSLPKACDSFKDKCDCKIICLILEALNENKLDSIITELVPETVEAIFLVSAHDSNIIEARSTANNILSYGKIANDAVCIWKTEKDVRLVNLDLAFSETCKESCSSLFTSAQGMIRNGFIAESCCNPRQRVVAYLPLKDFNYESYEKHVRKFGASSAVREANKARQEGFFCKPFPKRLHIPDIYDINTSAPERGGKPMGANYLRSIDEMGGAPKKLIQLEPHKCPLHNQTYFGVFESIDGYMQGDVRTDCRLVAYLSLNKYGNCAIYTLFLGHYGYRKKYVMNLLHFETVRAIVEGRINTLDGLEYLMYHRYINQNPGLTFWKKKMGFLPGYWVNKGELLF